MSDRRWKGLEDTDTTWRYYCSTAARSSWTLDNIALTLVAFWVAIHMGPKRVETLTLTPNPNRSWEILGRKMRWRVMWTVSTTRLKLGQVSVSSTAFGGSATVLAGSAMTPMTLSSRRRKGMDVTVLAATSMSPRVMMRM